MTLYLPAFDAPATHRPGVQVSIFDVVRPMIKFQRVESVRNTTIIEMVIGVESNVKKAAESSIFVDVTNVSNLYFVSFSIETPGRLWVPQGMTVLKERQLLRVDFRGAAHMGLDAEQYVDGEGTQKLVCSRLVLEWSSTGYTIE